MAVSQSFQIRPVFVRPPTRSFRNPCEAPDDHVLSNARLARSDLLSLYFVSGPP